MRTMKKLDQTTVQTEASKQLYNFALQKCIIGDYETAAKLLQSLLALDPVNKVQYMKTLASCFHHQQKLESAVFFYTLVCIQDEENNADCLLYLGDCLIKLTRYQEAAKALHAFMDRHSTTSNYAPLVSKVKLLQLIANKKLKAQAA